MESVSFLHPEPRLTGKETNPSWIFPVECIKTGCSRQAGRGAKDSPCDRHCLRAEIPGEEGSGGGFSTGCSSLPFPLWLLHG